jgi:RNA polymerase sigma-54 factor
MASNDLQIFLEPKLQVKPLPLPLLIPSLRMLTLPVHALYEELAKRLEDNIFVSVTGDIPDAFRGESQSVEGDEGGTDFFETTPYVVTMDEHVEAQLALLPELEKLPEDVVNLLVQGLNADGYLAEGTIDLVCDEAGIPRAKAVELVKKIQDFVDPPGLFAEDLVDCFLIQLRRLNLEGSDPWVLLREGKTFLEAGDMEGLKRSLSWSQRRIEEALGRIRLLDPHPGRSFSPTQRVVPEIRFLEDSEGLAVRYLHEYLPRIRVERDLVELPEDDRYKSHWKDVQVALRTLSMRARTKLRIALCLAERQGAFLLGKVGSPEPVVLEEIASLTGYHASTVQRVLVSTWAECPMGTISLSQAISRPLRARPDMSVARLREMIRAAKSRGKTDRSIAEELGIPRRTIAWHKNRMGLSADVRTVR